MELAGQMNVQITIPLFTGKTRVRTVVLGFKAHGPSTAVSALNPGSALFPRLYMGSGYVPHCSRGVSQQRLNVDNFIMW